MLRASVARVRSPDWWRLVDAGIAVVVLIVNLVVVARKAELSVVVVLTSMLLSCGVALRRWRPEAAAVVMLGGLTVYDLLARHRALPLESVAIVLVYYMIGRRSVYRGWSIVDAVLLLAPVPAIAANPRTAGSGGSLLVAVVSDWLFFLVVPFGTGRAIESWSRLASRLKTSRQELELALRGRTQRARSDERARMAREIHDIVAHSLSVMVIQTGAARRAAAIDPSVAARALEAVERCGRDALVDLRRMVGVVHHTDVAGRGGLAPGVAGLQKLAGRTAELGLPVELRIEGQVRALSPALDLCVFRVVQEALTNAVKHAGPATAEVVLNFTSDELRVEVTDSGQGTGHTAGTLPGRGGHGLIGMRERVSLFGGRLMSGEGAQGGFLVQAVVPLDGSVTG